jgi:dTDP-4-dehydrorhamnose 3,5-epimerase-like enzyme
VNQSKILSEIKVSNFLDERGQISVAELFGIEQFVVRRIYYISEVSESQTRGLHAHKQLNQIFFSLSGSFKLTVMDGSDSESFDLKEHESGVFLPSGYWRELSEFSPGAICLVLASEHYLQSDYIYEYEEYLKWKKSV